MCDEYTAFHFQVDDQAGREFSNIPLGRLLLDPFDLDACTALFNKGRGGSFDKMGWVAEAQRPGGATVEQQPSPGCAQQPPVSAARQPTQVPWPVRPPHPLTQPGWWAWSPLGTPGTADTESP
jgi:hypothetical protein